MLQTGGGRLKVWCCKFCFNIIIQMYLGSKQKYDLSISIKTRLYIPEKKVCFFTTC